MLSSLIIGALLATASATTPTLDMRGKTEAAIAAFRKVDVSKGTPFAKVEELKTLFPTDASTQASSDTGYYSILGFAGSTSCTNMDDVYLVQNVYGQCIVSEDGTKSYKDTVVTTTADDSYGFESYAITTTYYSDSSCTTSTGSGTVNYDQYTCYAGIMPYEVSNKFQTVKKAETFMYYNSMDDCDSGKPIIMGTSWQLDMCYDLGTESIYVDKNCKSITYYSASDSCTGTNIVVDSDLSCQVTDDDDDDTYSPAEYEEWSCNSAAAVGPLRSAAAAAVALGAVAFAMLM